MRLKTDHDDDDDGEPMQAGTVVSAHMDRLKSPFK